MRSKRWWLNCSAVVVLVGCGTVPEPSGNGDSTPGSSRVALTAIGATGYVHQTQCSKFRVGTFLRQSRDGNLDRVIGTDGVLATDDVTGSVRGILNADSAASTRPPLTADPKIHNARVLAYFESCGLPADQVGPVRVLTVMSSSGTGVVTAPSNGTFLGYIGVVTRVIDGIPVPDSFAAARFDVDDDTTMEWVYWPPIPTTAIDDAKSLQGMLGTPSNRAAFLARLPPEAAASPLEVTIRHSDFDDERDFVAFGSVDVHVSAGGTRLRGTTLHFDALGREQRHPNLTTNANPLMTDSPK